MKLIAVIFAGLILVFDTSATKAGPLEDFKEATAALQRGDYKRALVLYEALANQNVSGAQYVLGVLYFEGKGVRRDPAISYKWHSLAANNGHPLSQYEVGTFYDHGLGTQKNLSEAAKWFKRSAEQGYGKAQINLGAMYATGEGVPRDIVEAYKWFSIAARGGGYLDADSLKIDALKRKEALGSRMTAAQRNEGENRVRSWKPRTEQKVQQENITNQSNEVELAADFALKTCYESIDDLSRVRSYARLMNWEVLPPDVRNIMRPSAAGADYEAWSVLERSQQFMVSVHIGSFRGKPANVCQVSTKVSPELLVASMARKVRIGPPTSSDLGLQKTDIYQLLQHPTGRLALLIVSKGKDGQAFTVVGFMGVQ